MATDFRVEVGPGFKSSDPVIRWEDVTERFLSMDSQTGRNEELGKVETGTALFSFDNPAGEWTPGRDWVPVMSERFDSVAGETSTTITTANGTWELASPGDAPSTWEALPDGGWSIAQGGITPGDGLTLEGLFSSGLPAYPITPGDTYRVRVVARTAYGREWGVGVYTLNTDGDVVTRYDTTRAATGRWESRTYELTVPPGYLFTTAMAVDVWAADDAGDAWLDVRYIEVTTPNVWAGRLLAGLPIRAYVVTDDNLLHHEAVNPPRPGATVPRWHGTTPDPTNWTVTADEDGDGVPYFALAATAGGSALWRAGVDGYADIIQVSEGDTVTVTADVYGPAGTLLGVEFATGTSPAMLASQAVSAADTWEPVTVTYVAPADGWVRPVVFRPSVPLAARVRNVKVRLGAPPPGSATVASPLSGKVPAFWGAVERFVANDAAGTVAAECVDAFGALATHALSLYRLTACAALDDVAGSVATYYWPLAEDTEATTGHALRGEIPAPIVRVNGGGVGGFVSDRVLMYTDGEQSSGSFAVGPESGSYSALQIVGIEGQPELDSSGFEVGVWVKFAEGSFATAGGAAGVTVIPFYWGDTDTPVGGLEVGGTPGAWRAQFWWLGLDASGTVLTRYVAQTTTNLVEDRPYFLRCALSYRNGPTSRVSCGVNGEWVTTSTINSLFGPQVVSAAYLGGLPLVGAPNITPYGDGVPDCLFGHAYLISGATSSPMWADEFGRVIPAGGGLGNPDEMFDTIIRYASAPPYQPVNASRWRVNGRLEVDPNGGTEYVALDATDAVVDGGGIFRCGLREGLTPADVGNAFRVEVELRRGSGTTRAAGATYGVAGTAALARYHDGVTSQYLDDFIAPDPGVLTEPASVWCRWRIEGGRFRIKVWHDYEDEPAAWTLDEEPSGASTTAAEIRIAVTTFGGMTGLWPVWIDSVDFWWFDASQCPYADRMREVVLDGSGEETGYVADEADRITRLLGPRGLNWRPGLLLDPGLSTLIPARWESGAAWLTIAQDAAESAGGTFYPGRSGEAVYHSRHHYGMPAWSLGEHAETGDWAHDLAKVRNVVTVKRRTGASRVARNGESVDVYGERPEEFIRDLNDGGEMMTAAQWLAGAYGRAIPWCDTVTVSGTTAQAPDLLALALGATPGDSLLLYGLGQAAPDDTMSARVEGVALSVAADGAVLRWDSVLSVSPGGPWVSMMRLDDPELAALDEEGAVVGY